MRFSGKTVVITGAASGIGAESVRLFAREGSTVFASDIDEAGGKALVQEVEGVVHFHRCDVCDVSQIKELMDRAASENGGIDILFNNAGAPGAREPIDEIEPDGWDLTMDLLLRSVAMGIRYAAPYMKGRPNASIVNVSSVAAVGPGYSPTAYAVAKAGVLHLTKMAAADLAQYGIRVNAIQPGFIMTNIFTRELEVTEDQKELAKGMLRQMSSNAQPVSRSGEPRDIAEACAYLSSEAGSFMNGTTMLVDGGLTLGPRYSWDPDEPGVYDPLETLEEEAKQAASE